MPTRIGKTLKEPSETIGDRTLCAWLVAHKVTWVQTRDAKIARKLESRQDSRLVVTGVAGGYLRTYEFNKGLKWAARLIARYTGQTASVASPRPASEQPQPRALQRSAAMH